ncbi:MAG TPA: hypothetical protein VH814_10770 [Steroidobacteraceae bacterium]|jgi:hypothetical protein
MNQFEQQFEAHLTALKSNARAASIFVYTEITLHHFFDGDLDLFNRVNEHAGFWNGVLAALQTSGFIALGRMYDEDSNAHTIRALLRFVEEYIGLFRPDALLLRRQAAGMRAEDAHSFAEDSCTLKTSDLQPVRDQFETFRQLYKANVEPIRHKVFAHAGKIHRKELNELFTKVFLRDLERMVVFPLRLERALGGVYLDGLALTLDPVPTNAVEILNNLPGDATNTWEHFHAVKSAAAVAAWMKLTPAPPEKIDRSIIERLVRAMELDKVGLREEDFEGPLSQ